ncbi:hypothetical protein LG634_28785 [Streptomyces bambusae]|uniref:hypothetical protein n=1 Tax=Streptomyces bambusae TaxID=1550616 RepID=UPI001CFD8855|nr:hypothetical protein [Streptomyces bambusae]MCB5168804.1 hypothetical protein [Streptomyces bambusae]
MTPRPGARGHGTRPSAGRPAGTRTSDPDRRQPPAGPDVSENGAAPSEGRALRTRHLALRQQLAASGRGALAGAFRDAAPGRPRRVDFRRHVAMDRVGTMGHSRGGAGVPWQASDRHAAQWPPGPRSARSWLAPFNTRWSPQSREVAAGDDATHDPARPGQYTDPGGTAYAPQLTEAAQRTAAAVYIVAFFPRQLAGGREAF